VRETLSSLPKTTEEKRGRNVGVALFLFALTVQVAYRDDKLEDMAQQLALFFVSARGGEGRGGGGDGGRGRGRGREKSNQQSREQRKRTPDEHGEGLDAEHEGVRG